MAYPPADVLESIAIYLQSIMGESLASATGYPQVYTDYAPNQNPDNSPVSLPYAVVFDGPESYSQQSEDPATGHWISLIVQGTVVASFLASSKSQARELGRECVLKLCDTQAELVEADGRIIYLRAESSQSAVIGDIAAGSPTAFQRIVTIHFTEQYPS